MHRVNRLLSLAGLRLARVNGIPLDFKRHYGKQFDELKRNNGGFRIFQEFECDIGDHPQSYKDYECMFAAINLNKANPVEILDIGSYRHFIIGLLAHYRITTLDVRKRESFCENEIVLTADAKNLPIPSNSFDAVVSLCAIEHFGLGRYGDEFDIDADRKAFNEMVRVLKPGGMLIFTTTITRGAPAIAFNAHRIYNYDLIRNLCNGLKLCEEKFFSSKLGTHCSFDDVSNSPNNWDVYCGRWEKLSQ